MFHGGGWWNFIYSEDKRPKVTWGLLKRVLEYARPYRWGIITLLGTILITTALGLVSPAVFGYVINNALTPPNLDPGRLNLFALLLVVIPLLTGAIRVIQRRINSRIGEGVIYDLRVALYAHLQQMSLRFFTNTKTGELMSRLNDDVVDAQRAISNTIVEIITNVITVILTLVVMLAMDWRLTILGVIVLPLFILAARRVGGVLRAIARDQMKYNAQMNAMMNETLNISGALLVKLFGRMGQEVDRFQDRAGKVRDIGITRAVIGAQFFVIIGLVSAIGTALVYWFGGHLVINGVWQVGTIVTFGMYLTQLYGPLQALVNAPVDFATSVVSFERVFEVIDLPIEIAESPKAIALDQVRGEIGFHEVGFKYGAPQTDLLSNVVRYENDEFSAFSDDLKKSPTGNGHGTSSQAREAALDQLSFTIAPGQLVALVGRSGAGKTTLTYLIPRLYDPTSGQITIDGIDLREVTLASLAAQIGMVTQETYLFHDTIRTNLLYAKLDATPDEIERACRAANIHEFISALPDGYDTLVGERGYRLSGGEKQRLALARVILKNPRILVLDEATSSLDSESEALIQDALKTVMQGRTSIVIAHRLSTILSADVILVMDRGRIMERGTHHELLALNGIYAGLYETQFSQQRETV
ncbi:MAG: ABC transporter ATP-binding protein/permease [Anaerolineae bacterium]|jgi:ATP-binding cassette subfamily B protein|nr:ABC transporter ATP-binding protein/permease [Anaerolineae bacterium]